MNLWGTQIFSRPVTGMTIDPTPLDIWLLLERGRGGGGSQRSERPPLPLSLQVSIASFWTLMSRIRVHCAGSDNFILHYLSKWNFYHFGESIYSPFLNGCCSLKINNRKVLFWLILQWVVLPLTVAYFRISIWTNLWARISLTIIICDCFIVSFF